METLVEMMGTMDHFEIRNASRRAHQMEARMIAADNARLSLASWDPNANLARKLAERAAAKAVQS